MLGGNTAVVGGRARLAGSHAGCLFDVHLSFSDIWMKRSSKWRVTGTHVSCAAEQSR